MQSPVLSASILNNCMTRVGRITLKLNEDKEKKENVEKGGHEEEKMSQKQKGEEKIVIKQSLN